MSTFVSLTTSQLLALEIAQIFAKRASDHTSPKRQSRELQADDRAFADVFGHTSFRVDKTRDERRVDTVTCSIPNHERLQHLVATVTWAPDKNYFCNFEVEIQWVVGSRGKKVRVLTYSGDASAGFPFSHMVIYHSHSSGVG